MTSCAIPGCPNEVHCRGWCMGHYGRWRRHGNPTAGRVMGRTPMQRFMDLIDRAESGCWMWTGSKTKYGYGTFTEGGRFIKAHRWAVENIAGEAISDGMHVDHLCRTPSCVNPEHLEIVTPRENTQRALPYRRDGLDSECANGHPRTPESTYVAPDGRRACRVCHRETEARRRANRPNPKDAA